jgi:hypothetical protein
MKFASFTLLAVAAVVSDAFVPRTPTTLFGVSSRPTMLSATSKEDLLGARDMIDEIIDTLNANPVFVRLAWHDSGTFDKNLKGDWPAQGGAIGSIRFEPEITHGANNGLKGAAQLLEKVKEAYPSVTYADLYQMASARAIELAGGPTIDMRYGKLYCCCCLSLHIGSFFSSIVFVYEFFSYFRPHGRHWT